jgi:hypothetical protein
MGARSSRKPHSQISLFSGFLKVRIIHSITPLELYDLAPAGKTFLNRGKKSINIEGLFNDKAAHSAEAFLRCAESSRVGRADYDWHAGCFRVVSQLVKDQPSAPLALLEPVKEGKWWYTSCPVKLMTTPLRLPYLSDVTDAQWLLITDLVPGHSLNKWP